MWGVYWLPLSYLQQAGLSGTSAGIVLYIGCLLALLPVIWRYRLALRRHWRVLVMSGMLTGCAFSLYTTSLSYTDVIRSILLFYLTPVWGTFIGLAFLKERLTASRIAVLVLAFLGLYAILGSETGWPVPRNLGDVLALFSGLFWAIGSFGLLRAQQVPVWPQIISFLIGSLIVSLLSAAMISDWPSFAFTLGELQVIGGILCGFVVFALPMFWLTLAPARMLTPARVGILLMSEVVIGALSAMLLSGQPFGVAEGMGTLFIIVAGVVEVLGASHSPTPTANA
jgi:drug/metabolite transporter (DMT)-like permease